MIARRSFLSLAGTALASVSAHAQSRQTPVVGFLHVGSAGLLGREISALRAGLAEMGFVDGRTVTLEARWAEGFYERLPALASELVARGLTMIVCGGGIRPMRAAQQVVGRLPVVFVTTGDPVSEGMVTSLARPAGEVTGVTMLGYEIATKRFALLRDAVPRARRVAFLFNPDNPRHDVERREIEVAATTTGIELQALSATAESEFAQVFATMSARGVEALLVSVDGTFDVRRRALIELAARHRIPTVYAFRDSPEDGGLMSYGSSRPEAYRLAGIYAGRILNGAKPADLPVIQATRFELVVNLKTAKALGIDIPQIVLATADEVIE